MIRIGKLWGLIRSGRKQRIHRCQTQSRRLHHQRLHQCHSRRRSLHQNPRTSQLVSVPVWVDADQVLADVLDVLRLPPTDDDSDRIAALIPAAAGLIETYLDREDQPLDPAPPMHPLIQTAMTNCTIELYRRKDAPFGVLNSWSSDEMVVRISTDPLRGVLKILLPLKLNFGVA